MSGFIIGVYIFNLLINLYETARDLSRGAMHGPESWFHNGLAILWVALIVYTIRRSVLRMDERGLWAPRLRGGLLPWSEVLSCERASEDANWLRVFLRPGARLAPRAPGAKLVPADLVEFVSGSRYFDIDLRSAAWGAEDAVQRAVAFSRRHFRATQAEMPPLHARDALPRRPLPIPHRICRASG